MSKDDVKDLQRVLQLCDEALAKPAKERDEFLAKSCDQKPELRRAVDSLLLSVGSADDFLDPGPEQVPVSLIDTQVGDYRILKRLGEGGMGSVYLAEREGGDFEQRVAIKMVRRYMMSKELIERFDSERQLLAALHHPYIARLIDGGATDQGVPYFVMEYIEGVQIDEYCDQNKLDINERIALLQKVAMAVQAAHQNLIVHRDLKPANVLITHDGIPKLLDFGIAKLVDPARAKQSGHTTVFGHMPMTPDYSSPEQILEGTVTTAGDIYSLGVLSYELLTGKRPYELSTSSHLELMKSVEALTITKPSEHFTQQSSSQTKTWADSRSTATQQMARQLSGDLDRILLKSLHRDPNRRYESVGAFAKDFECYLLGMPVEARDDTLRYRASKFVARNKFTVGAATVTMMAIVAGLGFSLWQAGIAHDQSQKAQTQLVRAEAVSEFLGDILLSPNVNWDGVLQTGPIATIADVLAAAEIKLDSELVEYPEVRLELYHKISQALSRMEMTEDALQVQHKAVKLAEASLPASSPLLVDTYYYLAFAQGENGDVDDAIKNLYRSLELANQQSGELSLRKLYIRNDLAQMHTERHEFELSLELQKAVIDDSFKLLGPELKPLHTIGYANLGSAYISTGNFEEGRNSIETGLETHLLFPEQTESIGAVLLERYARLDIFDQKLEEAQKKYREAIGLYDSAYGVPNTSAAEAKMRLGNLLVFTGDYRGARILAEEAKGDFPELVDRDVSWSFHLLEGHLALVQADVEAALVSIRKAIKFGYGLEMSRFDRTDSTWLLIRALKASGNLDEARQLYKELIEVESTWIPNDVPYKRALLMQEL